MLDKKYPNEHKLITAAVSAYVFKDANRNPIAKLDKRWADCIDQLYIMVKYR
jgi:chitinase